MINEEQFSNEVMDLSALPKHEEVTIMPIQARYWNVILFNFSCVFLLIGAPLALLVFNTGDFRPYAWGVMGVYVLFTAGQLILRRKAFHRRGYAVRQRDLLYRRGLLATVTTIIPFNRIQHVALNEGVLSRRYGLAQLQVFTAGGTSANMRISGLLKKDADIIKEFIMRQIEVDETAGEEGMPTKPSDGHGAV